MIFKIKKSNILICNFLLFVHSKIYLHKRLIMKTVYILYLAFICISFSNAQKMSFENQRNLRIEKVINSQWTFNYFPAETADKGYESSGFDDSKWPAISIPHTWNTYETTGEIHPFFKNPDDNDNSYWWTGWGWYRKHFSINRDYSDKKVFIVFEGVQKYCKIWLNGKYLGEHKGDSGSFDFDITGFLKPGEDNVLAVAVNNRQEDKFKVQPVTEGNVNFYGGICGGVTLVLKNKLYIPMQVSVSHEGGTIDTTPQEGVVRVQTWVKNDNLQKKNCVLQTSLIDAANKTVEVIKSEDVINPGQLYQFDQMSKPIKNPHLWSTKDDFMNKVYSEVIDGKVVADNYISPPGSKPAKDKDKTTLFMIDRILEGLAVNGRKQTDETRTTNSQDVVPGDPARIVVTGSNQNILSDRSSVVIVNADIVDSKGNYVNGATNVVHWNVTGPATLIGPAVYESIINKHHQTEGVWYMDMPVSNIIRSTGKPGKIQVFVSANGLATGSFDIEAEVKKTDNSVINEPVLEDERRNSVTRITLKVNRLDDAPREIKFTSDEFKFYPADKRGFERQIRDYILNNNPAADSASIEFNTLTDLLASQIINNNGLLIAHDYNLYVNDYDNCRLIAGYIASTKLPPLYKEGLRKYYTNSIIMQGSEKNAGDEMNWLNWIPSGGTVVIYQEGGTGPGIKGAIITGKSDLAGMIAVVHPAFVNFSEEAKERALIFISKMNPYVRVKSIERQNSVGEKEKIVSVSYTAEKGQPVLIPLLKFISE
jgi:hypothetical protein